MGARAGHSRGSSSPRGGLPLGLQLAAKPFDEATLIRVGDAYQQATDWHLRTPELMTAAA